VHHTGSLGIIIFLAWLDTLDCHVLPVHPLGATWCHKLKINPKKQLYLAGCKTMASNAPDAFIIDGFGVQTRCPFENEVKAQKDYRFRKGGFTIIMISGCDVDGRFITALANHSEIPMISLLGILPSCISG
jgi:hypothetical protein